MAGPSTNPSKQIDIAKPEQHENPSSPTLSESSTSTVPAPAHQETPPFLISESSLQENRRFSQPVLQFKIEAEALKSAIAPLADTELNPEGFGTITMSANSLDITVRNSVTLVMCSLCLYYDALIDYEYLPRSPTPSISKGANVRDIFQNLAVVSDKEIVTVLLNYSSDTSAQLFFRFGDDDDHTSRFSVELTKPGDEEEVFSEYRFIDSPDGLVPDRELNRMITDSHLLMKNGKAPEVSVAIHIRERKGSVAVGQENIKKHEELKADSRASHNFASFYWYYAQVLEKAAALEESKFYVRIIEEPQNCVMMRFEYALGSLMFLNNAGNLELAGHEHPKIEGSGESI